MACVEACPVGIEHVSTIVDMRRSLVDVGEVDSLLQQTLENYGKQGNAYGKSARLRAQLGRGGSSSGSRTPARSRSSTCRSSATSPPSTSGCSSRPRPSLGSCTTPGSRSGCSYEGERNAGNDIRRIGEEGLFELLVEQNMGALAEAAVRGDLHHRPALAERAAQRVSAVRARRSRSTTTPSCSPTSSRGA